MKLNPQESVNQCQGCMAGWKLRETTPIRGMPFSEQTLVHEVEGGYNGEIVDCTKHLYVKEEN